MVRDKWNIFDKKKRGKFIQNCKMKGISNKRIFVIDAIVDFFTFRLVVFYFFLSFYLCCLKCTVFLCALTHSYILRTQADITPEYDFLKGKMTAELYKLVAYSWFLATTIFCFSVFLHLLPWFTVLDDTLGRIEHAPQSVCTPKASNKNKSFTQ